MVSISLFLVAFILLFAIVGIAVFASDKIPREELMFLDALLFFAAAVAKYLGL